MSLEASEELVEDNDLPPQHLRLLLCVRYRSALLVRRRTDACEKFLPRVAAHEPVADVGKPARGPRDASQVWARGVSQGNSTLRFHPRVGTD